MNKNFSTKRILMLLGSVIILLAIGLLVSYVAWQTSMVDDGSICGYEEGCTYLE